MKLIIGLGNPEEKFENTPHNVGSLIVKKFQESQKLSEFDFDKKLNSLISKNNGFIVCIPQTYMNESGKSVSKLAKYFKVKTDDILIIHDDYDLVLGKYKMQYERGSAGHKGIDSIIKLLGTKKIWRLRIGIRPIQSLSKGKQMLRAGDIVLKKFSKRDLEKLENIFSDIFTGIYIWLSS